MFFNIIHDLRNPNASQHDGKQNPVGIVNFPETHKKSKAVNSFAEINKMIGFSVCKNI